jgi:hypothetical protein
MKIQTLSTYLNAARATNTTDSSYPSRVPRNATPSGTGNNASQTTAASIIQAGAGGQECDNAVKVIPFGTGSSGNAFTLKLIGWEHYGQAAPNTQVWVPVDLCELNVTLGTAAGPGGLIPATMLFATSLSVTVGNVNVSIDVVSPGNNGIAHFVADLKGCRLFELVFAVVSSTDANALFAVL